MGPHDPFGNNDLPEHHRDEPRPFMRPEPGPRFDLAHTVPRDSGIALLVGAGVGAGLGVVSLLATWVQVFQVGIFILLGMAISWCVMGILSGRFDLQGAWRALRRRD